MQAELSPALILHRRPYRESSLLVEAFTRDHGRVGLVARGARRPRSGWRGLLEPLQPLRLSWRGRGELATLTAAEPGKLTAPLVGDNLYAGFYAGELILRLTARNDINMRLFDSFAHLLEVLTGKSAAAVPLRVFERDLLAAQGYALPLTQESDTGAPVVADRRYRYHAETGLRCAAPDAEDQDGTSVDGSVLLGLAAGELATPAAEKTARRLLAAALAPHLGGRPLRTVETLRAMRRLAADPSITH